MNKKTILIIIGIFLAAGVAGGVWLSSQEEQISCHNNLDCPMQMKCEDFICVDVGCVEEGGMIPGAISPEHRERIATECCAGLKGINYFKNYDADCNPAPLAGGPAGVCSDCGNGACEEWENKCNCAEDCSNINSGADCAKEGEKYSKVFTDEYPENCCSGLMEYELGMDTRKVENGECVATGKESGWPVGMCLNCGNGICEKIENICNCAEDCD